MEPPASRRTASRRAASQPLLQGLTLQHRAPQGRSSPKPCENKQDADQGMSRTQDPTGGGAARPARDPSLTHPGPWSRPGAVCRRRFPRRCGVVCTSAVSPRTAGLGGLAAMFSPKPETPFPRKRGPEHWRPDPWARTRSHPSWDSARAPHHHRYRHRHHESHPTDEDPAWQFTNPHLIS